MPILTGDNLPLPSRSPESHKGDYGHVLLIGGGTGMLGAIGLAALACLKCGAGVATIATIPEHAQGALLALVPEAMVYGIPDAQALIPFLEHATVCVIGPGLGENEWAEALFATVLNSQLPLVIDASALSLLAKNPQQNNNWILTPHPGEAAHLLNCSNVEIQTDRIKSTIALQQHYGGVIVLKGSNSVIQTIDGQSFICTRGNPGMASAGMGDVLTGVIAALLAQGLSLSEAAKLGVWVHASAGDHLAKKQGERGLLAHDLTAIFPLILNGLIT